METPMEVISEGEWSSLSGMYTTEEANFMAQLLGNPPLNIDLGSINGSSGLRGGSDWHSGSDETSFYVSSSSAYNFFPQIANGSVHQHESDLYLNLMNNPNNTTVSNGAFSIQSALAEGDEYLNLETMAKDSSNVQLKEEEEPTTKENINNSTDSLKKRSRSTGNLQKMKRNVKLKKSQSVEFSRKTEEDGSNSRAQCHKSSTTYCSEDDSSFSHGGLSSSTKETTTTLNLSGRTRASRGAATDPQSLYARKRRERINERLKVLQSLIPNGTKVDISTMLEEAVHYVKFLQLQIKLLSSDDLWMYAPIAYNGIDIGLDMRISALMR